MQNVSSIHSDLLWMFVTPDQVWGFVLTVCRLFGCLQFAPLTSDASIPIRIRLLIACVMAWLVVAITPFQINDVTHPLPMVMILELAIGATIGLSATLILMGLRGAADLIDQQSGLAMARLLDPRLGEEASPHASLLMLMGVAVFVLLAPIGGDLRLCGHLLGTFQSIPIGVCETAGITNLLTSALIGACEMAIGVAAPILILLSLLNWAFALWQRAEPSMNHSAWLLPLRIVALWLMLCWTASQLPTSLEQTLETHGPYAANDVSDDMRFR